MQIISNGNGYFYIFGSDINHTNIIYFWLHNTALLKDTTLLIIPFTLHTSSSYNYNIQQNIAKYLLIYILIVVVHRSENYTKVGEVLFATLNYNMQCYARRYMFFSYWILWLLEICSRTLPLSYFIIVHLYYKYSPLYLLQCLIELISYLHYYSFSSLINQSYFD